MRRVSSRPRQDQEAIGGTQAPRRLLAGIFLIALGVRMAFALVQASKAWNDSVTYAAAARELLAFPHRIESTLVMPLYPAFLGVVGWNGAIAWQLLLSASVVLIVYAIARRLFEDRRIAFLAALLAAFEPLSIYYSNQRLTETLYTVLLLASLLLLLGEKFIVGSAVFILATLTRPTLEFAGPVLVATCYWVGRERPRIREATLRVAVYGVLYVLLMTPWWIHNAQKYGQFVRLNLGDGIVMRVEHNPLFVQHGFWGELQPVFHEFDQVENLVERNAAYRSAALAFAREDLARYLSLCVRRFFRFFSPVIDQSEYFTTRPIKILALPASLLILCSSALFFVLPGPRGELRRLAPLLLVICTLTAVHVLIHGIVRYRTPLMPLLSILAAAAILRIWQAWTPPR